MNLKKTIVFLFSILFVNSNTEVRQLFKIPIFVEHYLEHQNHHEENVFSFVDFTISHYGTRKKHRDTDEHDEHENVPFKSQSNSSDTLLAFEKFNSFITVGKLNYKAVKEVFTIYKVGYISNVFNTIWQPPKLV
ncbi:MAG: hypothetical protein ACRC6O_04280 [Flavobacterium sp.]